jgi:hypothetical protein
MIMPTAIEETKSKTERGRQPDVKPGKVFTPKFERDDNGIYLVLTVPFNDHNGMRRNGTISLSVNDLNKLSAKIL